MKLSKKILLLAFVISMVCVLSVAAYAAPTLTIGTVEVEQGTATVDLAVTLSDNTGLNSLQYKIVLPNGFTLNTVTQGSALMGTFRSQVGTDPEVMYMALGMPATNNGVVDTFNINVPSEAGEYEITGSVVAAADASYMDPGIVVVSGKIIVKGAEAPAATLTAKGTSLYLDGTVGIKAYFEYTGAETLMINGEAAVAEGNNLYYAYLKSVPKNYKNEVTFTATASDVEAATITTSVANAIDEYQAGNYDDKTKALADALEVYCNNAEAFFGTGTTITVASAGLTAPAFEGEKTINGVTFNSTSLILEDTITLRHYFKVADGASATGFTGTTEDGFAYVEFTNINATALGTDIPVTVAGFNFSFAPVDYIALTQNSADAKLANLVNALYNYYLAAVKY